MPELQTLCERGLCKAMPFDEYDESRAEIIRGLCRQVVLPDGAPDSRIDLEDCPVAAYVATVEFKRADETGEFDAS